MVYHLIDDEDKLHHYLPSIYEYISEYEDPRIGIDLETYSLLYQATKNEIYKIPLPFPYYGLDREQLEKDAFTRTGMSLKSQLEGHTALIQVGLDPTIGHDHQFIFDARRLDPKLITKSLRPIIEKSLVIWHNGTYESKFLIQEFDIWPVRTRDTMILGKIIHAGDNYEHTLAGEYKKFIDFGLFHSLTGRSFSDYMKFKKENQTSDWTNPNLTSSQLDYAADDVRLLMYLYDFQKRALSKLIKRFGQDGLMDTIRMSCDLVMEFALMELRGVPLDVIYHKENVIDWLDEKFEQSCEEVGKYFSKEVERRTPYDHVTKSGKPMIKYHKWTEIVPINTKSSTQIKAVLTNAGIKLPKVKSTEAATLKKFRHEHPGIEYILRAKKAGHLNDNYGRCLIENVRSDGKCHYSVHVVGSKTNRSSMSDPNLQKIPMHEMLFKEKKAGTTFRRSFSCPVGKLPGDDGEEWVWISADLSQIELRAMAKISGDEVMIKELSAEDGDFHGVSGQFLGGLDYKPAKGTYERDTIGKTGGFQVLYKSGGKSLAEYMFDHTIDTDAPVIWTAKEAQAKIERFKAGLPGITAAMEEVEDQVLEYIGDRTTLMSFRGRKPVFEIFTKGTVKPKGQYTVYEKWCLNETHEKLIREYDEAKRNGENPPDKLSKWHKVMREYPVLDENGEETGETIWKESYWNEWAKYINTIQREAWNFLFQGECAILFKLATLNIGRELRTIPTIDKVREGIIFPVHDELNLLVKKRHEEQAKEIVLRHMIAGGELFIQNVPMKAEIKSGKNWAECH